MCFYPPVSIVVAAYNAQRTIRKCLDSLLALDYPTYSIIVVDNDSSDFTETIVKQYNVKYLLEKRKGWPAARNTGIASATTNYVANIDADCFATTNWLKNLTSAFKAGHKDLGCVVGKTLVQPGHTLAQQYYASTKPFDIENKIGKTDFVPWGGGNNLILRDAFILAGGYDWINFKSGADGEFHYRLLKEYGYKTVYQPNAIIYHAPRGSLKEFFQVSKKYTYDGYSRFRLYHTHYIQNPYRHFLIRKLYHVILHTLAFQYRGVKTLVGKSDISIPASHFFSIINLCGSIYGYTRAKMRTVQRKQQNVKFLNPSQE